MRKRLKALGLAMVLLVVPIPSAAGDLSGTWQIALDIGTHHIRGYFVLVQAGIEISGTLYGLHGSQTGTVAGAIDMKNNEAGLRVTLSSGEKLNFYATAVEADVMTGTVTAKDKKGNPMQTGWKAVRRQQ
jgi:hypothetical protein